MSNNKINTFEKIERIAVVTEFKRDFNLFCINNKHEKKVYFHVCNEESCCGFIFDDYVITGEKYLENIVDIVKTRIR